MGKNLSGPGGMGGFMREAQKQVRDMQKRMADMENQLAERVVEGAAGGGMVKALVNGKQEVLSVKISPEVVDPEDIEMLEDLVTAACNQAIKKAGDMRDEEMKKITGGMGIPGMPGLF